MAAKITLKKAVDRMMAGARLMRMNNQVGTSWYLVPGGEVTEDVARLLTQRPDVVSSEDGLFPGIPQTYRIGGS